MDWNKFLDECKKRSLKVSEDIDATLWDEADYEHKPTDRTDAYVAKIDDSIVILENPDGHLYCLFIVGGDISKIQDIWDEIVTDEEEDEDEDEDEEDEDEEDEEDEDEDEEDEEDEDEDEEDEEDEDEDKDENENKDEKDKLKDIIKNAIKEIKKSMNE